ncbi:hypothetical protein F511_10550 [Dorcoceras hygrometricum]|uniref:Uncharacterized protein n=1 Tax=Dorcoceras hygrometricum TaxID=472368 RepID=A0A2Z7D001_9LAMI|nr:hypothetical protein F511_10550 [Dorcoceras hygrometricum]
MQIDSDLVIYLTALVRTFQVSTRSVLGKCVYLVTLAMSLFDLQDVCIAIGSLATLDLPMVIDLIGIYVLKGPYCTLTTTDWFLQALSVIPRGSWGDVARRFTMIRWAVDRSDLIGDRSYDEVAAMNIVIWTRARWAGPSSFRPLLLSTHAAVAAAAADLRRKFVSGRFDEENPFVQNSSVLLVQPDEGVSFWSWTGLAIIYRNLPRRAGFLKFRLEPGTSASKVFVLNALCMTIIELLFFVLIVSRLYSLFFRCLAGGRIRIPNKWFRDTVSRGPTTIVAPESQFRTCPTDHDSIGYPRMSASGEFSTTMHRILHTSGSHPIPTPYDLHAQNITMLPTNETWYFASQILVSNSGGLILILTAQSTRNMFRIHSDY